MALPWTKDAEEGASVTPTALGEQGAICSSCAAGLAIDQRYCLNCGTRRAGPRLDFEKVLFNSFEQPAPATAAGPAVAAAGYPTRADWTPFTAIGSIAVLGAMLLLGVLIGKDDDSTTQQIAAAPALTAPAATAPTAAAAPAAGKGGSATKAAAAAAPAEGIKGGSGDTEGIATANDTALTGSGGNKEQQEASKKIPDQVATSGQPVAQDNKPAGGGSGSTCIGC